MKITRRTIKLVIGISLGIVFLIGAVGVYRFISHRRNEVKALKKIIMRLEADSRVAEVLVTEVVEDRVSGKTLTTIKFLEYDTNDIPLKPQYFTFAGNIIQFQSLVIRFEDSFVRGGHSLKGRSAYLFWKVFTLHGHNTQEYQITKVRQVPEGYRIEGIESPLQELVWEKFWDYALDPTKRNEVGIKNAQIEAPGTMFVPGALYTIKIEHDGGMRIDAEPLSPILRGERIPDL